MKPGTACWKPIPPGLNTTAQQKNGKRKAFNLANPINILIFVLWKGNSNIIKRVGSVPTKTS